MEIRSHIKRVGQQWENPFFVEKISASFEKAHTPKVIGFGIQKRPKKPTAARHKNHRAKSNNAIAFHHVQGIKDNKEGNQ